MMMVSVRRLLDCCQTMYPAVSRPRSFNPCFACAYWLALTIEGASFMPDRMLLYIPQPHPADAQFPVAAKSEDDSDPDVYSCGDMKSTLASCRNLVTKSVASWAVSVSYGAVWLTVIPFSKPACFTAAKALANTGFMEFAEPLTFSISQMTPWKPASRTLPRSLTNACTFAAVKTPFWFPPPIEKYFFPCNVVIVPEGISLSAVAASFQPEK